jgi:hypothetical protein
MGNSWSLFSLRRCRHFHIFGVLRTSTWLIPFRVATTRWDRGAKTTGIIPAFHCNTPEDGRNGYSTRAQLHAALWGQVELCAGLLWRIRPAVGLVATVQATHIWGHATCCQPHKRFSQGSLMADEARPPFRNHDPEGCFPFEDGSIDERCEARMESTATSSQRMCGAGIHSNVSVL